MSVVNTFSGIGWDFAAEELGLDVHGIDIEPTVTDNRPKLGWQTTTADILDLDPNDWTGVDGLIASPPCQSWSRAGKRLGLDDPRGELVWQPLVWALACRPRWVACEQVPEARGAFELIAHGLRENGYHADVYELSFETFGVPQTRRRVFMVAHRDRAPHRPAPTHQRFRKGRPRVEPVDMLGLLPWVSMAEVLSVPAAATVSTGMNSMSTSRDADMVPYERPTSEPAPTANSRGSWQIGKPGHRHPPMRWKFEGGKHQNGTTRDIDEPAPTLTAHIGKDGDSWTFSRPTTVCADPRVSPPVHHDDNLRSLGGAVPWPDAGTDKPIALTEAQGCRLMAFPDGTHNALCGTKKDRWRIIGNAVCPPVAHAVLATLIGAAV